MYLLDTNIVSELRRVRPHGAVVDWIVSVPAEDLYLPTIVAGEIQIGIERTVVTDSEKAAELSHWLDSLLSTSQWIDADAHIFRVWARLTVRTPPALMIDALIAATALHRNLTVVTRNIRDFSMFGVAVLNPFERQKS